jgi:hypothetical protein
LACICLLQELVLLVGGYNAFAANKGMEERAGKSAEMHTALAGQPRATLQQISMTASNTRTMRQIHRLSAATNQAVALVKQATTECVVDHCSRLVHDWVDSWS